ncbi:thermonuclease family protein [Escherichia coli]|uniref:thermonuclease family protein n=1 Tax=Escherichia coli TaxID=562 RepID=UPI00098CC8CC
MKRWQSYHSSVLSGNKNGAWVYEQYNTDPVLPVLQNEARQQKRGLWSDADPVPPWIWRHRK